MSKLCGACGRELPTRQRKWCDETCRKRGQRAGVAGSVSEMPVKPGRVEKATRSQLEAADRLDTPAGASALVLAAKLDRGGDTGSAIAALVRELRSALVDALEDVTSSMDPVDRLQQQRLKRQQRAGSA
jgi:hypothetical protein